MIFALWFLFTIAWIGFGMPLLEYAVREWQAWLNRRARRRRAIDDGERIVIVMCPQCGAQWRAHDRPHYGRGGAAGYPPLPGRKPRDDPCADGSDLTTNRLVDL